MNLRALNVLGHQSIWLAISFVTVALALLWLTNSLPLWLEGILFTHGLWRPPHAVSGDYVIFVSLVCFITIGILLYLGIVRLTKKIRRRTQIIIRSFALACFFTPSALAAGHSFLVFPAIVILAVTPWDRRYAWSYAFLWGLLPIVVVWVAIAITWFREKRA